MLLVQVPAARPHHQHGRARGQPVDPTLWRAVFDAAGHRVAQVGLALDHVRPGRRAGVLEVAMNTRAPEFRPLITILRSTGPV
ncbi:hypothetical protein QM565_07030, partial [Geitlerinema splendidum]|nr:hypothetical protein [Geitlerinema splendidum]